MSTYFVILTCRNSEKSIKSALNSLLNQSVKPDYIIVIDDGSKDNTSNILREIQSKNKNIYIITNPDLGYDIGRVVVNWNKALKLAQELNLKPTDYHMIGTDDTQFEVNYSEKIMRRMESDISIAIASGNYDNNQYVTPHGAGRFIRNSFFNSVHGYYSEKMGYESLVLHTAMLNGFKCIVIQEARFIHTRKLGSDHHFFQFGASMRTLGYHPLFVFGRFIKYFCSGKPIGRINALYMLYYYLTYTPKENGYNSMHEHKIRNAIRQTQAKRIRRYIGLTKHSSQKEINRF